MNLAHIAAEHDDMGDARHRQQPRLDDPIGVVAQSEGINLVGQQSDHHQVHGARNERRQFRSAHARRQGAAEFGQALRNALTRDVHVDAVGESDGHHGQAGNGFRAQRRKPGRAVDGVLDLFGDQLFDLLRGESGRLGLNVHLRRDEFREDIERRLHGPPGTERERQQGQHGDRAIVAHAKGDQGAHHGLIRGRRAGIDFAGQQLPGRCDDDLRPGIDALFDEVPVRACSWPGRARCARTAPASPPRSTNIYRH